VLLVAAAVVRLECTLAHFEAPVLRSVRLERRDSSHRGPAFGPPQRGPTRAVRADDRRARVTSVDATRPQHVTGYPPAGSNGSPVPRPCRPVSNSSTAGPRPSMAARRPCGVPALARHPSAGASARPPRQAVGAHTTGSRSLRAGPELSAASCCGLDRQGLRSSFRACRHSRDDLDRGRCSARRTPRQRTARAPAAEVAGDLPSPRLPPQRRSFAQGPACLCTACGQLCGQLVRE
jgi:hypothetical protein